MSVIKSYRLHSILCSSRNIRTPPTEGLEFPGGVQVLRGQKIMKKCKMKLNWNLQRVKGSLQRSFPLWKYGYFLKLYIVTF